jgi:WD40 repeat protein/predicted Ser/Thr protein kinase
MTLPDGTESSAVYDFVEQYLRDRRDGQRPPLTHYLARFPDQAEAIAREYLRLQDAETGDPAHPPLADPEPATIGRYRVLRELGRGGQGAVLLAEDTRLGRRVALKILPSYLGLVSEDRLRRFRREAELVAKLEHPGICPIYEADLDGGVPFIVMRYVEGETLASLLKERRDRNEQPRGAPAIHEVARWAERLARALHAAHEAGVIHRDVKPSNIVITPEREPVILDFGLARPEVPVEDTVTLTGTAYGTLPYMSPEQIEGPAADLDRRADVYSLGVVLYEALTLARPFSGRTPHELQGKILAGSSTPPQQVNPTIPRDLRIVVETALERDRGRRYPTALELAEDLRRFREYEPIRARPLDLRLRFLRWMQRHPIASSSVAVLGIALVVVSVFWWRSLVDRGRARAFSDALLASGEVDQDPIGALEKALAAADDAPRPQVDEVLYRVLDACHQEVGFPGLDRQMPAFDPLGRFVAQPTGDGRLLMAGLDPGPARRSIRAHLSAFAVAVAPDGSQALTGGEDGHLRLWDTATWRELWSRPLREDAPAPVRSLAFSPDGRWAAAGSTLGRVALLDLRTRELRLLPAVGDAPIIGSLSPAPTGDALLALVTDDHLGPWAFHGARVLEIATGAERAALDLGGGQLESVSWSPAGDLVAFGLIDGRVRVTDARTGAVAWQRALPERVNWAGFDPREGHLLVPVPGGLDFWDWRNDRRVRTLDLPRGRGVSRAAFRPDGGVFAVLQRDGRLRLFETDSWTPIETGSSPTEFAHVLQWERTGSRLFTSGLDHADVWRIDRGPIQALRGARAPGRTVQVAVHPSESWALCGFDDPAGTVRLWDPGSSKAPRELRHGARLRRAGFSPAGDRVFTAGEDGVVRFFGLADPRGGRPALELRGHAAPVVDARFAGDGVRLLTIGEDGLAVLWDTALGKPLHELRGHTGPIRCAAFLSGRGWAATGGADHAVKVWDLGEGRLVRSLDFHPGAMKPPFMEVGSLAWDEPRDRLLATQVNNHVRCWRISDWSAWQHHELSAFGGPVAVSEAAATALLADYSFGHLTFLDLVRLDPAGLRRVGPGAAHTSTITRLALSPDGRLALTASRDGSVRIWDVARRELVSVIRGDGSAVLDAAWTPDGSRILTGSFDGHVKLWPIDVRRAAREYLERYRSLGR